MATQGNKITYSEFPTSWVKHQRWSNPPVGACLYVSSASFDAYCEVVSVLFRKGNVTLECSYYDPAQGKFVKAGSFSESQSGANNGSEYFGHNYGTSHKRSWDKDQYHLWKLKVTASSSSGSANRYIGIRVGGIGMMGEAKYNNLCKDKLIASAGNLSGDNFWYSSTEKDADALSKFWNVNRGTQILVAYVNKLVPKTW